MNRKQEKGGFIRTLLLRSVTYECTHFLPKAQQSLGVLGKKEDGTVIFASNSLLYRLFKNLMFFMTALFFEFGYFVFLPSFLFFAKPPLGDMVINIWVISMVVGQAVKDILLLPRPPTVNPKITPLEPLSEYGFPSTHIMCCLGVTSAIAVHNSGYDTTTTILSWLMAFGLTALTGLSRLFHGVHSFTDMIGGFLLECVIMFFFYGAKFLVFDEVRFVGDITFVSIASVLLYGFFFLGSDAVNRSFSWVGMVVGVWHGVRIGIDVSSHLIESPSPSHTKATFAGKMLLFLMVLIAMAAAKLLTDFAVDPILGAFFKDEVKMRPRPYVVDVPRKFLSYSAVGLISVLSMFHLTHVVVPMLSPSLMHDPSDL